MYQSLLEHWVDVQQNTLSIIRSPPVSSDESQLSFEFSEHEIYTKIHPGAFSLFILSSDEN
jgi:hypothetical protein